MRWTCAQISSHEISVCICTRLFRDPTINNLLLRAFAMFYYKWYLLTECWKGGGKGLILWDEWDRCREEGFREILVWTIVWQIKTTEFIPESECQII